MIHHPCDLINYNNTIIILNKSSKTIFYEHYILLYINYILWTLYFIFHKHYILYFMNIFTILMILVWVFLTNYSNIIEWFLHYFVNQSFPLNFKTSPRSPFTKFGHWHPRATWVSVALSPNFLWGNKLKWDLLQKNGEVAAKLFTTVKIHVFLWKRCKCSSVTSYQIFINPLLRETLFPSILR